jgi:hypothetical protein
VRYATGIPTGAPTGTEGPVAFDNTPVNGGSYLWVGAFWVKAADISSSATTLSTRGKGGK